MGFGEPAAQNIDIRQSQDGSWRNVLFNVLVELRRLAMYGPHPALLSKAFNAYAEKILDDAADAGSRTGSEIVQELYGDLSANFTYYHPNEKLNLEKGMISNGMAHHAFNYIKGEASLLWKGWVNLFNLNITDLQEKQWLQKIQSSPRVLLQVAHNSEVTGNGQKKDIMLGLSEETLYLVSDQVAKASLNPPNEPKGRVKSDDFLKKKEDDDFMEHVGRRKYVKHSVEHEKETVDAKAAAWQWAKSQRLRPSITFATGDKSDDNDAQFSDALPTERRGHLLDYKE